MHSGWKVIAVSYASWPTWFQVDNISWCLRWKRFVYTWIAELVFGRSFFFPVQLSAHKTSLFPQRHGGLHLDRLPNGRAVPKASQRRWVGYSYYVYHPSWWLASLYFAIIHRLILRRIGIMYYSVVVATNLVTIYMYLVSASTTSQSHSHWNRQTMPSLLP